MWTLDAQSCPRLVLNQNALSQTGLRACASCVCRSASRSLEWDAQLHTMYRPLAIESASAEKS